MRISLIQSPLSQSKEKEPGGLLRLAPQYYVHDQTQSGRKVFLSGQLEFQLRDETTVFFQDPLEHRPLGRVLGHTLDYL